MHPATVHRLIAALCLVAFGLGQAAFTSIAVRCTDASGHTRIEYACVKSPKGACLTPCAEPGVHAADDDHTGDPTQPTPCEDEPLGPQFSAARVGAASETMEVIVAAVLSVVLWDQCPFVVDEPARCAQQVANRDRPPDSLVRLRSVILTV